MRFKKGLYMQMQNLGVLELGLIVGIVYLYFLPSLIAFLRGYKNTLSIFLLNVFLGWTVLGWVSALVWSVLK